MIDSIKSTLYFVVPILILLIVKVMAFKLTLTRTLWVTMAACVFAGDFTTTLLATTNRDSRRKKKWDLCASTPLHPPRPLIPHPTGAPIKRPNLW